HGLVDTQHPELSGLVLSMVNQEGKPVNGFLRLQDIFNLNLPVELVVLRAREKGIGKEVRGEFEGKHGFSVANGRGIGLRARYFGAHSSSAPTTLSITSARMLG